MRQATRMADECEHPLDFAGMHQQHQAPTIRPAERLPSRQRHQDPTTLRLLSVQIKKAELVARS